MKRLFWLHDESLSLPADWQHNELLVYVWDNDYFRQQQWSLKRLIFIYETLCELPVSVFQGQTHALLSQLCQQHGVDEICVQQALDPTLQRLIDSVARQGIKLTQTPYPQIFAHTSLKSSRRFHAYWKQVAPFLGLTSNKRYTHHKD